MEMASKGTGFESSPDVAHADFANMFIGGGVLSGGCVQEEIRFAICPELCLSMLVCPCMLEDEAIQILGGEQFSAYSGYAFNLRYAGDHKDTTARTEDGTVLVSILAMDALDLRGQDASLKAQLAPEKMLRDLNKSLAAFTPVDEKSLECFEMVATGNWGCGAFGGCPQLKALLQWASASQCGRGVRYFPFDQDFGPELQALVKKATAKGITVGHLLSTVWAWNSKRRRPGPLSGTSTDPLLPQQLFQAIGEEIPTSGQIDLEAKEDSLRPRRFQESRPPAGSWSPPGSWPAAGSGLPAGSRPPARSLPLAGPYLFHGDLCSL
jgi:hypothetical protein